MSEMTRFFDTLSRSERDEFNAWVLESIKVYQETPLFQRAARLGELEAKFSKCRSRREKLYIAARVMALVRLIPKVVL